ncbi:simple sugar transport system permease protein [Motilibacter peucedani]|uniref:Simple sugar transport system permease protein n=1 Tax=Motilibacter peucedani TaxID=598650 RepID=A0A420XLG0_9ACTN|nr:ABC transporter permease [Motilibacter peucedani]RKS69383.1 simple sugar transport system permease protein [Motilibacter peucedani]
MSTVTDIPAVTGRPLAAARRPAWQRALLALVGGILLLSVVRVVTGADELSSSGTLSSALALAVPIGLAGLGGLWAERAGVVNIGLEGMMIAGTFGAGWMGYQHGPWLGLVAGIVFGAVGGLLHAVATVTFGVDHIISGVAINILGLGATQYLADRLFTGVEGGGPTQSPQIPSVSTFTVPGTGWLLTLEKHHWLFVSDVAALLRALTFEVSWFTLIALLLVIGSFFVLWRTTFGLRLRSCGEDPWAAESLGVKVLRYKYAGVVASGALAGFAGAFLAEVAANVYREGQTGGRGYIGLAAMIFGNWRPGGLAGGALLFGYTDGLQFRRGEESVHALLLLLAAGLIVFGVVMLVRRRALQGVLSLLVGVAVLVLFLVTDSVAQDFISMTPYVATLLVLALASQRLRPPAADGVVYRKGEGH